MIRGQIFKALKAPSKTHPIIFWDNYDGAYFIGLMLTHSPKFSINVDLSDPKYFQTNNDDFSKSLFVCMLLLKPVDWLQNISEKALLSNDGIEYISQRILNLRPIVWEKYEASLLSNKKKIRS